MELILITCVNWLENVHIWGFRCAVFGVLMNSGASWNCLCCYSHSIDVTMHYYSRVPARFRCDFVHVAPIRQASQSTFRIDHSATPQYSPTTNSTVETNNKVSHLQNEWKRLQQLTTTTTKKHKWASNKRKITNRKSDFGNGKWETEIATNFDLPRCVSVFLVHSERLRNGSRYDEPIRLER